MRHAHIKAVLPRLRRHAYLLAGDRTRADDSVYKCLEAYKANPSKVRPGAADVDMFRLFHEVIRRPAVVPTSSSETTGGSTSTPSRHQSSLKTIAALPRDHRHVLSLVAVEGFSPAQCSQVLGLDESQVTQILVEARQSAVSTSLPQRQMAACS